MPKIPGIPHLRAVQALEKAGFRIARQGKHIVMTDGRRIVTIPRHDPVDAFTMAELFKMPASPRRNFATFSSFGDRSQYPRRIPRDDRFRGDTPGDDRSGAHDGLLADGHATEDRGARSDRGA